MGERQSTGDQILKRTDFCSLGDNLAQIHRMRPEAALAGALGAEKYRGLRGIDAFSKL
jgi:hypothetical protein